MTTKVLRESDVENYLRKRVKELGGEIRKVKWIGRRNAMDNVVAIREVLYPTFVEVKRPGKKPTAAQQREIDRLTKAGFSCAWVSTYQEVDVLLSSGY